MEYFLRLNRYEYTELTLFMDLMRRSIGDNFNLSVYTYSGYYTVDIKTDSTHVTLFMLLLRLGLSI